MALPPQFMKKGAAPAKKMAGKPGEKPKGKGKMPPAFMKKDKC